MKITSQPPEHKRRVQDVVGSAAKTKILVLIVLIFLGPLLRAQQTVDELRDLARNPVGDAVQGLLRHADAHMTLQLYAQSVNSSMVEAQESMLKAILRNGSNAVN
jgi:phosphohistidine phosphatase SixA